MLSMTGYGKGIASDKNVELSVEVKSVNNRYLDINIRMPKQFMVHENSVREMCKKRLIRGKVSVMLELNEAVDSTTDGLADSSKFRKKLEILQLLKSEFNLQDPIKLEHLVAFPDLFETDLSAVDDKLFLQILKKALSDALDELNQMRSKEGSFLKSDMISRIDLIKTLTAKVFSKSKPNVQSEFERLKKQVLELIGEQKIDETRLEQEIAIIADKVDITEECVRLQSHLKLFEDSMNDGMEMGKKLNFILQEMLREANTINSKSTVAETLHDIIQMKEEIEKLREQVQNIE